VFSSGSAGVHDFPFVVGHGAGGTGGVFVDDLTGHSSRPLRTRKSSNRELPCGALLSPLCPHCCPCTGLLALAAPLPMVTAVLGCAPSLPCGPGRV
jgi:hypothetical protein